MFREDSGQTRFLDDDEEARLLTHCRACPKPIIIAALHTGFRKSELLSLTWRKVDFRHQLIKVTAGYSKNGEARSIPMTTVLTQTLRDIRITGDPDAAIFRSPEGKPYRDVSTSFSTAVRRARIADFTFHDLRHTFASRLVMRGVDLTTVQELMGHKHIHMTLHYARLAPGHRRSAIAVLDQIEEEVPSIFTAGTKQPSNSISQPVDFPKRRRIGAGVPPGLQIQ